MTYPTGRHGWPTSPFRRQRVLWGLTAVEAARASGIDAGRWQAIETGSAAATAAEVAAIAPVMRLSSADLRAAIAAHPVPQSEAEAWFEERIEASLFVRRLTGAR